jgi:hypothetical protein
MNSDVFKVRRKINPLESYPCRVPGWSLDMNMIGFPFIEPAFASIHKTDVSKNERELHGVVYKITPEDFDQIRRTEGGGGHDNMGYEVVEVDVNTYCGKSFVAKTLVAHADWTPKFEVLPTERYLKLLRNGAKEHGLDPEYAKYLEDWKHYDKTGLAKKIGMFTMLIMFLPIFLPFLIMLFTFGKFKMVAPRPLYVLFKHVGTLTWMVHDYLLSNIASGCK